jgi:bifunctional ADP-heptose synthase (sugar kinase/adenylyltransferase)
MFSNHAAGVVVGKIGTAVVTVRELLESFQRQR